MPAIPGSKRPPLAKAAREFIASLELPPEGKRPLCVLLIHSLLLHAHGLQEGATMATSEPSLQQLAEVMHCSTRTVRRAIESLRICGTIQRKRRGDGLSSVFTIHQKPVSDRTTVVHSETETREDNSQFRLDKKPVQSGQLASQTGQQLSTSGVELQGRSPSGVILQEQNAEPNSKATARPSESEIQSQTQRQKQALIAKSGLLRNLPECSTLAQDMCSAFQISEPHCLASAKNAIASTAAFMSIPLLEACSIVRDDAQNYIAKGRVLDWIFFDQIGPTLEMQFEWDSRLRNKTAGPLREERA